MSSFTASAYLSLLAAGCLLNVVALMAVWPRRSVPGSRTLAVLLLDVILLLAATAFSMVSATPQQALFWHFSVRFCTLALAGPLTLLFLLHYLDYPGWRGRWPQALLMLIPAITIGLVWTNPLHHLFAQSYDMARLGSYVVRTGWQPGGWFVVHAVYGYACFLITLGVIVLQLRQQPGLFRRQLWLVTAGVFPSVFLSVFDTLQVTPDRGMQLLPFGLALTGPVFALALTRHRLLDLIPIAYSAVFDSIEDPIIVLDGDRRMITLNPAAAKLIEPGAKAATGRKLADVLPGLAYRLQESDSEPARIEFEHEARTYDVQLSPLRHRQQRPGSLLVLRDVTASKQAESRLRSLSKAIEHSPATVVITDTEGTIEYVNPRFTLITGYTMEEAIGQNPRILKSGQTPPAVHRSLWKTITAGEEWFGEFVNRKKNGDLYWEAAAIAPVTDDDGRITHFVAVKEDITARKRIESELDRHRAELESLVEERTAEILEGQQRYRALFDAAKDAIFILTLDGVHISANSEASHMLGYSLDELIGLSFRDVVAADDIHQSELVLPRLLAGETIPIYERHFRRKNGEVFPVEVNVVLVRDKAGEPLHIQSIVRDITRRKRDEEALKDAYRQLMKLDDMKTDFINSISHELRTPITNLKLYHHLLAANPGKSRAYADTLQTQTSRLEEIVEGILFMQNVQQDLTDFDVTTVNFTRLVTDVIQRYEQISQHTGVEITCQSGPDDVYIPADRTLLQRALAVLLDNGVKYTPGPGVVNVTIERAAGDPSSPVTVRVTNPAGDLTPEDIPRLFERFYRGHNALTRGQSGAGLGLSIARQIVEQHGGELTAHCDPASPHPVFIAEMRLPVGAT